MSRHHKGIVSFEIDGLKYEGIEDFQIHPAILRGERRSPPPTVVIEGTITDDDGSLARWCDALHRETVFVQSAEYALALAQSPDAACPTCAILESIFVDADCFVCGHRISHENTDGVFLLRFPRDAP